jgi:hypothetical protein
MRRVLPVLGLLAVLAAGCGDGQTTTTSPTGTAPTTTTTATGTTALRVHFLEDGRVQPVAREVPKTRGVAAAALNELAAGPTKVEERDLQLTSEVDAGFGGVSVAGGVAHVEGTAGLSTPGLAQAVFTLTQFPTVKAVEIDGKRYTRADFEDETPIILVESPLPFQHVKSPLRATGTANTFEATFNYDLTDPDGKIIATHFVTATSGSGTRGTFDFTVPFTVDRSGLGELIVYELSAANGQRIHLSEVPVYLEK